MRLFASGEGKTETFWTRNVKLIAFLVTVAVLLGIPTVYFLVKDYKPVDTRPQMTLSQLKELASRPTEIGVDELEKYCGEREERQVDGVTVEVYYYLTVEDRSHLDAVKVLVPNAAGSTVTVGKDTVAGAQLAYLCVYDRITHERLDLLSKKADVNAFFGE